MREPARDHVEHRREDQPEDGDPDHAGEHRGAERLPQLGAGADRPDQRRDAEDEGERGHQDRPQPQARRLDRRGEAIAAAILELLGEFHDQDGVLGGETDQHDEADLRQDIVVLSAQHDADDRGDQAHRHDQDDRERQRQALELRRQHQEHEHHRQHEGEDRGIAGAQSAGTRASSTRSRSLPAAFRPRASP